MSYLVIKVIRGRRYLYEQCSWREGKRVRTQSRSLGPIDSPVRRRSLFGKIGDLIEANRSSPMDRALNSAERYAAQIDRERQARAAGKAMTADNSRERAKGNRMARGEEIAHLQSVPDRSQLDQQPKAGVSSGYMATKDGRTPAIARDTYTPSAAEATATQPAAAPGDAESEAAQGNAAADSSPSAAGCLNATQPDVATD